MFIKMDKTQPGADDHDLNKVNVYSEGETYEMGEILAGVFIREKWGHQVKKPKGGKKDNGDSDENKEDSDVEDKKDKKGKKDKKK